ncbi:hypothetical protein SCHPADRAFT_948004 [Schizopora paradoxa]|uniref:KOW domain-containing protein n=1 Tax=Schizopora paradoxa TaxID=27342 RepID=A0A0H2R3L2_9AGAM|nr:hypothetical protein SCHPADRAFT_948004 [Schizopora paradoxa]
MEDEDATDRGPSHPLPFKDLGGRGFVFQDNHYTNDGHILLRFRKDRLERVGVALNADLAMDWDMSTMEPRQVASDHLERTMDIEAEGGQLRRTDPSQLHPRSFIQEGDGVRVVRGSQTGAVGRVIEIRSTASSEVAVVDIGKRGATVRRSIFMEATLDCLERNFEYGEVVEVMVGRFKGRLGTVAFCKDRKVGIVCTRDFVEFEVPVSDVATYVPPRADLQSDYVFVHYGFPVRIRKGKHAGKTGRVAVIEHKYVKILEDVTDILLVVRRDNIEISGEIKSRPPESDDEEGSTKTPRAGSASNDTIKGTVDNANGMGDAAPLKESDKDSIENKKDGTVTEKILKPEGCSVDHFKEGFEGQLVYAWRGHLKGKIGWVIRTSGSLCRLSLESAMKGRSVVDVKSEHLVAKCACVLAPGVKPKWTKEAIADISILFDRSIAQSRYPSPAETIVDGRYYRPPTPPTPYSPLPAADNGRPTTPLSHFPPEDELPLFHDPSGPGMWIFHPKVARLRRKYDLLIKIDFHKDWTVSGKREGRILSDTSAPSHPIPIETPATVLVKFTDGKQVECIESLPVETLSPTSKLKVKGTHIIVKGDRIGTLVTHLRTERNSARVFADGQHRLETFSIEKHKLCIAEESTTDLPIVN